MLNDENDQPAEDQKLTPTIEKLKTPPRQG